MGSCDYDNNDLFNGSNNQNPNSSGEANFTSSAPIQNNPNAEFTDFTHGNLAYDNLNQQGSFSGYSVVPNSVIQMGINNQNLNLVSHPNGQTNYTDSASIQNNQNVEFTNFTHGNLIYNNFNQQGTFNSNSDDQNDMIQMGASNNQNLNLVLHPNGQQTKFTDSTLIQTTGDDNLYEIVRSINFTHGSLVQDNFIQQSSNNNNSAGQNSMILTGVNNNNDNNMSTTYQKNMYIRLDF
ncbi:8452_t:CDS:2 [Entrophospora sp. SA101]|nr:8452_t:CDS:2 [Entrophospora sp. SA101]